MSSKDTRLDLDIEARLMTRLMRFARQRGITPQAVLIRSVEAFLDSAPIDDATDLARKGTKPAPRK